MFTTKFMLLFSLILLANCFGKDSEQDFRNFLGKQSNRDLKKINEIINLFEDLRRDGGANFVPVRLINESSNEKFIDSIISYLRDDLYISSSIDGFKEEIKKFEWRADNAYKVAGQQPVPIKFK